MRVAILTPDPAAVEEWRWAYDPEARALADAGADVEAVPWTQAEDLGRFDVVAPLVAWGYHSNAGAWHRLLDQLEADRIPVRNPVPVLRWNSDKSYLAELASAGVSTIPTIAVATLDEAALERARTQFQCSDLVVKPNVSASAYGTHRLGPNDPFPEQVRGWRMLIQPWIEAITASGEYSLIFFDGEFSHAVSKVPKPGEFRVQPEYGGMIARCDPPAGSLELAQAALAAAPAKSSYARVDIVVGNNGDLQIIELELIEPALFLAEAPEAAETFARALLSAVERPREQPLADR